MTQDYGSMVWQFKGMVWETVPQGGMVAVVSKGDPEMLTFDSRVGMHYPQTPTGDYLGYHPATGPQAVTLLEDVRQRGAEFLAIPSTSQWWLNHYTDLRLYLETEARLVRTEEGIGQIYALDRAPVVNEPQRSARETQLRELVTAILPDDCVILAAEGAYTALLSTPGLDVRQLDALAGGSARPPKGAQMAHYAADYIVIPPALANGSHTQEFDGIRRNLKLVTEQRHVAAIYSTAIAADQPATKRR